MFLFCFFPPKPLHLCWKIRSFSFFFPPTNVSELSHGASPALHLVECATLSAAPPSYIIY